MITDKHAKHAKALTDLLRNSDAVVPPGLEELRPPAGSGFKRRGGGGGGHGGGGPSGGHKRGRFDGRFDLNLISPNNLDLIRLHVKPF